MKRGEDKHWLLQLQFLLSPKKYVLCCYLPCYMFTVNIISVAIQYRQLVGQYNYSVQLVIKSFCKIYTRKHGCPFTVHGLLEMYDMICHRYICHIIYPRVSYMIKHLRGKLLQLVNNIHHEGKLSSQPMTAYFSVLIMKWKKFK